MTIALGKTSTLPPTGSNGRSSNSPRTTPPLAPTRKRKRLRKEEILAEATRLFSERGYEGASMGDLAERVGLRKASLFHHFPSKDALYATVLGELLASVKAAVLAAAKAEGSYVERLDAMTDAIVVSLAAEPHAARLLFREAMDRCGAVEAGADASEHLGHTLDDVLAEALELVKAGQREGLLDVGIDGPQLIVSLFAICLLPFAIGDVIERFAGASPFQPAFVEARRAAIRQQVRALVLGDANARETSRA